MRKFTNKTETKRTIVYERKIQYGQRSVRTDLAYLEVGKEQSEIMVGSTGTVS